MICMKMEQSFTHTNFRIFKVSIRNVRPMKCCGTELPAHSLFASLWFPNRIPEFSQRILRSLKDITRKRAGTKTKRLVNNKDSIFSLLWTTFLIWYPNWKYFVPADAEEELQIFQNLHYRCEFSIYVAQNACTCGTLCSVQKHFKGVMVNLQL